MTKAIKLNWDDVKAGGQRLSPGYHKVDITEWKEVMANSGSEGWEFKFENAEGFCPDTFWLTEKAYGRLKLMAEAAGIRLQGEASLSGQQFLKRKLWILVESDEWTDRDGNTRDGVKVSPWAFKPASWQPMESELLAAKGAASGGR